MERQNFVRLLLRHLVTSINYSYTCTELSLDKETIFEVGRIMKCRGEEKFGVRVYLIYILVQNLRKGLVIQFFTVFKHNNYRTKHASTKSLVK